MYSPVNTMEVISEISCEGNLLRFASRLPLFERGFMKGTYFIIIMIERGGWINYSIYFPIRDQAPTKLCFWLISLFLSPSLSYLLNNWIGSLIFMGFRNGSLEWWSFVRDIPKQKGCFHLINALINLNENPDYTTT